MSAALGSLLKLGQSAHSCLSPLGRCHYPRGGGVRGSKWNKRSELCQGSFQQPRHLCLLHGHKDHRTGEPRALHGGQGGRCSGWLVHGFGLSESPQLYCELNTPMLGRAYLVPLTSTYMLPFTNGQLAVPV
ncbi:Hypothetical predicted protein [Marmota monax]|uniref:Uncharacterized protein n=1 Tax=Marmota monax TaxID=9995 RepID=A0A5E4CES4_MARMO|nr:hypothetical protein GHT09_014702 [Marmota monax]VTJ79639.1 Hypothetical predicted protein [Marmota monax]